MREIGLVLSIGIMLGASIGCYRLLEGGLFAAQAAAPISDQQEISIGQAGVEQIFAQPENRLYREPQVNAYVSGVGWEMARQTGRANLPWQFFLLESPQKNAFSLPGGMVFVTTGILRSMDNRAQLAGVLGHEAGHIGARHGIAELKRALLARGILISALGDTPLAGQIAGQLAAELVLRGYGRQAEFEADELGASYSSKANYDPRQLEIFLRDLAQGGEPPAWLSPLETHPPIQERIERLEKFIQKKHLGGSRVEAIPFKAAMAPLGKND
ncbi:MAG TPA: M48 family metalloprotease [Chroococcales cyanobacterium]|jgi:predicted Zn-dependent protease